MSTFLGKLKDGMDQAKAGAQVKIHEAQLRAQLRTLEREKADAVSALGAALYAMHEAGEVQLETLHGQLETVDGIGERMAEKQNEIDDFLAQSGASPAGPFTGTTPESANRHCSCGAVLSPAAKFCPECGKSNAVDDPGI